jgi:predicted acylesterase/phospholipase RssA
MPTRAFPAVALLALSITACGQPRPVALQGPVCQSMATYGQLPVPWPDITPAEVRAEAEREARARRLGVAAAPPVRPLMDIGSRSFRDKIAAQAAARQGPTRILAVSAGGAWGAFSIGFLDGWGMGDPVRQPPFDIVTGVSAGAMIAPAVFLGDEKLIAQVRALYANLKESDVYTVRSPLAMLSSPSLFDTAPLRAKLDKLLRDYKVVDLLAAENDKRTLAVMATNLDSGVPEVFDLTAIAADTNLSPVERQQRILAALMAASALPIAFPPEFIAVPLEPFVIPPGVVVVPKSVGKNMYVDGGVRLHVFFANEFKAALVKPQLPPLDITIVVSGDLAVSRDCTGLNGMGLVSVAGRTAVVATDQLLRGSVNALLLVGAEPGNQARMINARRVIDYYGGLPPPPDGPPRGKCPLSHLLFDPVLEQCLANEGAKIGAAPLTLWDIAVTGPTGGQPLRVSGLP